MKLDSLQLAYSSKSKLSSLGDCLFLLSSASRWVEELLVEDLIREDEEDELNGESFSAECLGGLFFWSLSVADLTQWLSALYRLALFVRLPVLWKGRVVSWNELFIRFP
jgi:hypothetical protein